MCHDGSAVMAVSADGHGCRALDARIAGCVSWRVRLSRGRNCAPSFKGVVEGAIWLTCLPRIGHLVCRLLCPNPSPTLLSAHFEAIPFTLTLPSSSG